MEKNTYTIKISKTKETGEKYFVIQQYLHKNKQEKYESKMNRYHANCSHKQNKLDMKKKRFNELFEVTEETINKKIKIVTSKPNPSKGTKTDIVFEWTPEAKAAKAELDNQKITHTIAYTGKDGKEHSRTIRRVATAKDFAFTTYPIKVEKYKALKNATSQPELHSIQEKNKERRKTMKACKIEKLSIRAFSDFHNNLISKAFSGTANHLKKAAEKAAHDEKIQKLMKEIRNRRLSMFKYRLEFRKFIYGVPKAFITNYSNKKIEYLEDIVSRLAAKLKDKINDFISINIYNNNTNELLKVKCGYEADPIHYRCKLDKLRNLYPNYYKAAQFSVKTFIEFVAK